MKWEDWNIEDSWTYRLTFLNEEEGVLSCFVQDTEQITFLVYPVAEGEAELRIQDIGLWSEIEEIENIPEIVIRKITKCIIGALDVMGDAGYPEVSFLAEKATKVEKILGSTRVVRKKYSEYMMYLPPEEVENTINCSDTDEILRYEEEGGGYICRNADRSFFARVAPYGTGWYVYEVEVRYDRRRTGIGTACMRLLAERFLQLYLQVGSYNEPAVCLYRKLGFQVIEELCYYGKAEEGMDQR
ncbi:MAG: GNAT family N-acetyltransferase [Lachnospiraceae bacterium]|nr:GNAT family N-acetyltransferase [Lachnospiraceae bacterium]